MRVTLTRKQTEVLEAVVISYIGHGMPVGSKHVVRSFKVGLGPASIRNLMAELEALGLLAKPHTSAGRVPTEKGYRVYVDRVMKPLGLKGGEARAIRNALSRPSRVDSTLDRISRVLESLSHHIGIALTPQSEDGIIERFESVRTSSCGLVVTARITPGRVRTVSLTVNSPRSLDTVSRVISKLARLITGREATYARHVICGLDLSAPGLRGHDKALRGLLYSLVATDGYHAYVYGSANVVSEIGDAAAAKALLRGLESRQALVRTVLPDLGKTGVTVSIGTENRCKTMKSVSVVSAPYSMGTARGAIGVIGPLRMDYPRLVPLVDYASRQLNRLLTQGGGR